MLDNENLIHNDIESAILVVLIHKNSNIKSIRNYLKKVKSEYIQIVLLQGKNDKEFIKKYKYIVDLMEFNFLNMQASNN